MPFENPPQNNTEPYVDKLTPEEEKKLQAEIKRKAKELAKKGVAIVNAEHLAETEARDAADAILGKEKSKKGWFGKLVQTYTEVYRRTKKVNELKKEIKETGNIYAGQSENNEDHNKAMSEIAERFTTEFGDKLVNTKAGEEWKKLDKKNSEGVRVNEEVRNLVKEYASTKMDEQDFKEAKKRIFKSIKDDSLKGADTYADNLFEIAKNTRLAIEHGIKLEELDLDFDIIIGKAKSSLKTEAKYSYVDQISDKLGKTVIGKYISAPTLSTAVGIAYTATVVTGKTLLRNKLGTYGTFGLTALASGVIMGADKAKSFADERRQHQREMAKGNEIAPDSKRRQEMDKWSYQTIDARKTMDTLYSNLYKKGKGGEMELKDMTEVEMRSALATISDIEARINVGDDKKIDLITYSKGEVEKERTEMEIARARAKVQIEKLAGDPKYKDIFNGKNLDDYLDSINKATESALFEGEKGISKRDKEFRKQKYWEATKKGFWTAVVGATIGTTVQEVSAVFNDKVTGIFEGIFSKDHIAPSGSIQTPLEHLRGWITGHPTHMDTAGGNVFDFGHEHIKLPPGYEMVRNPDGTFNIGHGNETIGENIALNFNADGSLSQDSAKLLGEHGIIATDGGTIDVGEKTEVNLSAHDYLEKHPEIETHQVSRDMWYDNDTPKPVFDFNELKEQWGGVNGTGIDEHGNFVMNVKQMSPAGSWHENGVFEVDAQEKIKNGGLKLLLSLSEGTQGHPVYVDIDEHGNAIINPNSEVGKLFFGTENGHAVFKGRFAEVAEMMGNKDGVDHVRLLATVEGKGIDEIKEIVDTLHKEQLINLGTPLDDEPPYFIPLMYRNPLEPVIYKKFNEKERDNFIKDIDGRGGPYGYGYGEKGSYGLLNNEEYKNRLSKKLLDNNELDVSENDFEIINEYLNNQNKEYLSELELMIKDVPQMNQNVEVSISIPAFRASGEGEDFEKIIRTYSKLKNRDKFELVIFENHSKNKTRDGNTSIIVDKLRKEFPDMNIVLLYKEFNEKPPIGEIRKYLVDSILLRKQKAGIDKSIAIVSNDADPDDIDENYSNYIAEEFKKDSKLDAVGGKWDYPERDFEKFPLLHGTQRLWHYFDIVFRNNYLKSPELIGRNSAFRSGIYAGIGGYNKNAKLAEDLEIGWMIKNARNYDTDRIKYLNKAWLVSSSRRATGKMLSGGRLIEQYGDFHENENVRNLPINELLKNKIDFDEETFMKEVQSIYDYYNRWKKTKEGGWIDDSIIDSTFGRAMGFLGVKYEKIGDKIIVTDVGKLIKNLEKNESSIEIKKNKKEELKTPQEIVSLSKEYTELVAKDPELKKKNEFLYKSYFALKNYYNLKDEDVIMKNNIDKVYQKYLEVPENKDKDMKVFLHDAVSKLDVHFAREMKKIKEEEERKNKEEGEKNNSSLAPESVPAPEPIPESAPEPEPISKPEVDEEPAPEPEPELEPDTEPENVVPEGEEKDDKMQEIRKVLTQIRNDNESRKKLVEVRKAVREYFNECMKDLGLIITPRSESSRNDWIDWRIARQTYEIPLVKDKNKKLDLPLNFLDKNNFGSLQVVQNIVDRQIGLEIYKNLHDTITNPDTKDTALLAFNLNRKTDQKVVELLSQNPADGNRNLDTKKLVEIGKSMRYIKKVPMLLR